MSLHERILRLRAANFVGREKELALFRALLRPENGGVLNIYGVGGIGKSTLLDQFIEVARGPDTLVGRVDGKDTALILTIVEHQRVYNVLNLLESLANQLGASSIYKQPFRAFSKEVEEVRRLMQRLERRRLPDEKNALALGQDFLAQAAGGATGVLVAGLPGAFLGAAVGTLVSPALDYMSQELRNLLAKYRFSKGDVQRALNAATNVTRLFVSAVNRLAREHQEKVVLLFDTYEEMGSAETWMRTLLLKDLDEKIVLVIAGRDRLADKWREDLNGALQQVELEPFSDPLAREYLQKRNVTDPQILAGMVHDAAGLPLALSIVAESTRFDRSAPFAPVPFLALDRSIVERFLSQIQDEQLREVVYACSLTLTFDTDLLQKMLDKADLSAQMRELLRFSFVEISREERFSLNDRFREFVSAYFRQERPETAEIWNKRAIEYYEQRIREAPLHDLPMLYWNYLHHCFFGDEEARDLLVAAKSRKGLIEIRTATSADLKGILQVDWVAFPSTEDRFQLSQIKDLYQQNKRIFTVARDLETGEIRGFSCIIPLKREFALRFESGNLDIQEVLAHTVVGTAENPDLVDYMLDSLVLRDPTELSVGALLIRHLGRELARPRKLYSIVTSDYGRKLLAKLKFHHFGQHTHSKHVVHDFCVSCLYDSSNPSPIVRLLARNEKIPMARVCADCRFEWCYEWDRHIPRLRTRPDEGEAPLMSIPDGF